jgi:predicted amidophosphoribosyltransferase
MSKRAPKQIKYQGQIYKLADDDTVYCEKCGRPLPKHVTASYSYNVPPPKHVTANQYVQAIMRLLHVKNPRQRTQREVLTALDNAIRDASLTYGSLEYVYEILDGLGKRLEEKKD